MNNFIEKIKSKPEHTRRKIFFAVMAVFAAAIFILYLISIKNSVKSAALEISSEKKELEGKFVLPGLKDSLMAGVKDALK